MTPRKNALLVAFLAFQLLLPLRGFLQDRFESRGDFSWNMYSRTYTCHVDYRVLTPSGERLRVHHKRFFQRSDKAMNNFNRERLPRFHAWLCDEFERQGSPGELRGSMRCWVEEDEPVVLVPDDTPICSATNHGVR